MASPDIADALALTFARPVFPKQFDDMGRGNVVSDYNPIEWFEDELAGRLQAPPRYIAPGIRDCDRSSNEFFHLFFGWSCP